MRKVAFIALGLLVVGLYGYNVVPGITKGVPAGSNQADALQREISQKGKETTGPIYIPGSERASILFVEDYSGVFGTGTYPDPNWQTLLNNIVGTGNYGWYATTAQGQNGPDLATMQNYDLVIWNCYDDWWAGDALTPTDQNNIASYMSGGGKVWLIGQDIIYAGSGSFVISNFHVASYSEDYQWNDPTANVSGLGEIAGITLSLTCDYASNGFYGDDLTPDAQAHWVLLDNGYSTHPAVAYPNSGNLMSSFWAIDGRGPSVWADWELMVYKMLDAFGVLFNITSYIWDFETGWQGWTKTGAYAFPNGWDVQPAVLHGSWQCPDHGDSSMWFDDDAAGSSAPSLSDTAKSPVVRPPLNMYLLKWGITYNYLGTPEYLEVGLKHRTGGVWSVVPLKTYTTDITSAWDSADVSLYVGAESVQVYFYYYDGGGWMWYGAFDNVQLLGSATLQHDARTMSIVNPGSRVPPGVAINPQARFRNAGANTETFDVSFVIDSSGVVVYTSTINLSSIPAGAETVVTFNPWTPANAEGIVYNLTAFTALAGDMNPANDTVHSTTLTSTVGEWIQCTSMPSPELSNATGYDPVNDRIYSFGGTPDGGYTYHNYTFQYDPVNNTWQTMANMPYAGDWIDASYVNGKFYIFGLYDGSVHNYNMIYDVTNNSWTTGANMPQARIAGGQVVYNDSLVYMLGGYNGSTPTNNVQIYNTYTNAWTTGTSLPTNFMMGGVAMTGDTIWIVGGYSGSAAFSNLYYGIINPTNCEQITWYTGAPLPVPNMNNGATQMYRSGHRYLYIVGGFENAVLPPTAHAWEYDIDNNVWTALPDYTPFALARNDFLIAREGHNEIYVCGGDDNGDWTATDQVWKLPWFVGPGVEEKEGASLVTSFGFAPNMPNPTKGSVITYTITKDARVSLKVYDASGRLISTLVDGRQTAGTKTVNWNTKNLSSGIYFLRLEAEGKIATHKLILVK